ncbi:MAG: hypothetical protein HC799_19045 [Limnothrix sp. RL_2_0]|nr:hypothetical protein [Limnothrix sp. RL_2_0]
MVGGDGGTIPNLKISPAAVSRIGGIGDRPLNYPEGQQNNDSYRLLLS